MYFTYALSYCYLIAMYILWAVLLSNKDYKLLLLVSVIYVEFTTNEISMKRYCLWCLDSIYKLARLSEELKFNVFGASDCHQPQISINWIELMKSERKKHNQKY